MAIPMALFARASPPWRCVQCRRGTKKRSYKPSSWPCLQNPRTVLLAVLTGSPPRRAGRALATGIPSPCHGQPQLWHLLPSGAPGAAQPWPPPRPELPLLIPRLCHRRFWDHLPISVACSLKLIICQCELGWDCAGLAGDQNLPSFQSHPAQPPRSGSSPAATTEGQGMRCCLLEGKKVPNKLRRPLPMAGTGHCTAPMLRWSRIILGLAVFHGFPGSWGHTGVNSWIFC